MDEHKTPEFNIATPQEVNEEGYERMESKCIELPILAADSDAWKLGDWFGFVMPYTIVLSVRARPWWSPTQDAAQKLKLYDRGAQLLLKMISEVIRNQVVSIRRPHFRHGSLRNTPLCVLLTWFYTITVWKLGSFCHSFFARPFRFDLSLPLPGPLVPFGALE